MNQANRLMSASGGGDSSRINRIRDTAFRYYDNIRRSGNFNSYRDSSYSQRYSRSVYMGLNNG